MPYINVYTNGKLSNGSINGFIDDMVDLTVNVMNKSKEHVAVIVENNENMGFGGSGEKGALVVFRSIGFGGKEAEITERVTDLVALYFGLDASTVAFELGDLAPSEAGIGGKLFG